MSVEGQPITVLNTYTTFAWVQPEGSGLSQAQANALYLRKTKPDTATALETFNQGILVENTADFNGNVNVYQNRLYLANNAISPNTTITVSPVTGNPFINIISPTNEAELLSGSLGFTQNGAVQVGNTRTLSLGTVGANVALGTAGQTTTINGTVGITGVITNYARTNATNTFLNSQTFTGGVYNIFATSIAGNTGQLSQSLFTNTANSTIALGNNSTVTLSGLLQFLVGNQRVQIDPTFGIVQEYDYTTFTNVKSVLLSGQLYFLNQGTNAKNNILTDSITMDSNINTPTVGYMTQITTDATQSTIVLKNKNNSLIYTTLKHNSIALNGGSNQLTLNTTSVTSLGVLSLLCGNTSLLNIGTTASRTADINIGTGMTSGNINVGAGASILDVSGSGIKFETLSTNNPTSTQSLYSNKTGGLLNLGAVMTSGNINCFATTSTGVLTLRGSGGLASDYITSLNPASNTSSLSIGNTTQGNVYIASSAPTGTTNYLVMGTSAVNDTYLRGKTVKIADESGNVFIGTALGTASTTMYGIVKPVRQVLIGTQPTTTNHTLAVGPNAVTPNGIICWSYDDTNAILSAYNVAIASRGGIQGVNSTTIAFNTTSDRRLKTNIKPMKPMLEKMMSLKPSEYGWTSNDETGYGFIAQEVHQLFPEMRYGANKCENLDEPCDSDGKPIYYGLDYGKFSPYIVKAIQEMKLDYETKISKLEERLLALENRIA